MLDDENVAGLERDGVLTQRLQEFFGQRITGFDFVGEGDRDNKQAAR